MDQQSLGRNFKSRASLLITLPLEAEPCPTGDTIKLDPKDKRSRYHLHLEISRVPSSWQDFIKGPALAAPPVNKDSDSFSCLPSVSAAAMAAVEARKSSATRVSTRFKKFLAPSAIQFANGFASSAVPSDNL